MNKLFKKFLVIGISLLMLIGVGVGVGSNNANAAGRRVRRSITVYRYHPNWAFYHRVSLHSRLRLHRGKYINVKRFYHQDRDGYVLHVYGHRGQWYARTNSHYWFYGSTRRLGSVFS